MSNRFYTRGGDDGTTGLLGEGRVNKNDPRMEALGAIDELSAGLGMARALCPAEDAQAWILQIQRDLYGIMAQVAATPEMAGRFRTISAGQVNSLESWTDHLTGQVEVPREFIIPGDTHVGAVIDLARTFARRAERRLAELNRLGLLENMELMRYLNRLSSFLFVLELRENRRAGSDRVTLAKG